MEQPWNSARRRTVFISSRMDELAMERRAAFSAIYDVGCIPLLFEIEPPKKDKKKIDLLVDRADFFLGLTYLTFGSPNPDLYMFRPVEYEFFRFVMRFLVTNSPNSWDMTEVDRRRVNDAMKQKDWRDLVRDRHYQKKSLPGEYEVGYQRALGQILILDRDTDGSDLIFSRTLSKFLEAFEPKYKRQYKVEAFQPPKDALSLFKDPLFVPAHVDLYRKTQDWLKENTTETAMPEVHEDERLRTVVGGKNRPGVLLFVLECLFQYGLNIEGLIGGEIYQRDENESEAFLTVHTRPFHFRHTTTELASKLQDTIDYFDTPGGAERALTTKLWPVLTVEPIRGDTHPHPALPSGYQPRLSAGGIICLAITTCDVPGAALSVAKTIFQHADIKFIVSQSQALKASGVEGEPPPQGIAEMLVAFEPGPGAPDTTSLVYQLGSLIAVRSVRVVGQEALGSWVSRP